MMGPAGHGQADPEFPLLDGWEVIHTVVDVGGGTGDMLAALLRHRPHLRGILVDLPGTIARAADTFRPPTSPPPHAPGHRNAATAGTAQDRTALADLSARVQLV